MTFDIARIRDAVDVAHRDHGRESGGRNASYIPSLASVPSELSGLALTLVDGQQIEAGDSRYSFAIESISKVATLALALEQHGPEVVQRKIGADPTGMPFNSVTALELHDDRPQSPLVNAGAMATVSLLQAADRSRLVAAMSTSRVSGLVITTP